MTAVKDKAPNPPANVLLRTLRRLSSWPARPAAIIWVVALDEEMALGRKAKVGTARQEQATTIRSKDVETRMMAVGLCECVRECVYVL